MERALVPSASRIIGSSTAIGAVLSIIFWLSSASSDTPPIGYMLVIGLIAGAAVGFGIARALTMLAIWKLSSNSPVRRLWHLPAILGALCPLTGPLFGMAVSLASLWTATVLGVLVGCVVSALRFKSLTDQAALRMSRAAEQTAEQIRRIRLAGPTVLIECSILLRLASNTTRQPTARPRDDRSTPPILYPARDLGARAGDMKPPPIGTDTSMQQANLISVLRQTLKCLHLARVDGDFSDIGVARWCSDFVVAHGVLATDCPAEFAQAQYLPVILR